MIDRYPFDPAFSLLDTVTEPYPIEALFGVPTINRWRVSPDREQVAFVSDSTGRFELFLIDMETAKLTQLTEGELMRDDPGPIMWAPDGSGLYFQQARSHDRPHVIRKIATRGTVETILTVEERAHLEDVSPDGSRLLVLINAPGDDTLDRDLYRYDLEPGELTQLTDYDPPVRSRVQFSPDGTGISYQVYRPENSEAYVSDIDGESLRQLAISEQPSDSRIIDWHPDGRRLLAMDDASGVWRPGVYDLDTDSVTWHGPDGFSVVPWAFLPDGTGFLAGHYRDVTTAPVVYSLDGDRQTLPLTDGVAGYPTWVKPYAEIFLADDAAVLSFRTEAKPTQLISCDIANGSTASVLEAADAERSPEHFVKAEYITYESEDDLEIGALLYRPETSPAPAVVHIHGGPATRVERNFEPYGRYAQFFVSRGYAVLQPNFRGSTGRGRDFRTRIHGDWGGGDAADVVAGNRWLKAQEWVDEERVGAFGQSYGAYGVFVQLTKFPEEWTAGIAWNGPATAMGGGGGYSPLANVENVDGPLLMLAGEHDRSVESMREFAEKLIDRGLEPGNDVRFEILEDEGHHSLDTDQHLRRFRLIEEFLHSSL